MFWILRKTRFKSNSLLNVIKNSTLDICSTKKNYNKLTQQSNLNSIENFNEKNSITNSSKESTLENMGDDYTNSNRIKEEIIMDPVRNNNNINNYCNYDEALTCNVCDTSFDCSKQLFSHKLEKRHYRCDVCDSFFQSSMALEHHKEVFEHWFDDDDDEDDDYSDFGSNESIPEELESLL